MSTESGIPDFRGPNGLWTKVDPDDFTIERWLTRPDVRARSWKTWKTHFGVQPNKGHMATVKLAQAGRLAGVVTQNVDGLHHESGLTEDQVAELHGTVRNSHCVSCHTGWRTETVLGWIESGSEDPRCPNCDGLVKTDIVLFGELLPEAEMVKASAFLDNADTVIVLGSTVSVWPAADVVFRAAEQGKPVVVINRGDTDIDAQAEVVIDETIGQVFPRLVETAVSR